MDARAIVLVGVVVSALLVGWVLVTPSTDVPVGVAVSTGDSMGYDGSRILVYADVEPSPGDIIVFQSMGKWVAHRVVGPLSFSSGEFERQGWQTKGDAREKPDQWKDDRGYHATNELARSENTAGVVVAWVGLGVVLEVVASVLAAVGTMNVLEATPPIFSRTPQGGR